MIGYSDNPFLSRAKSNDLRHEEIRDLWIQYEGDPGHPGFQPRSPMATIVLGGKGSGKTHLFRYFSFPVQGLRYGCADWTDCLRSDGYLGIYSRANGLNGSRFKDKGVDPEAWREVFRQYMELWLADGLLRTLIGLREHVPDIRACEAQLATHFSSRLDVTPSPQISTLSEFHAYLVACRHRLDVAVNAAAFDRTVRPDLVCTAGSLVFGLPELLVEHVPCMKDVLVSYYVDECENLLDYQQRYVNTLVRERSAPTTFRIGARSYGMRTFATDSGDKEDLRVGSEYDELRLDTHYRKVPERYGRFAVKLLERRVEAAKERSSFRGSPPIADWFARRGASAREGHEDDRHLTRLRDQLAETRDPSDPSAVVEYLRCRENVILEKAAIFRFYQHVAKGQGDFVRKASSIATEIREVLAGEANPLSSVVEHYRGDFAAQIARDRRLGRQVDCGGLDDFVIMSEGLPRELLNLIGNVLSSASFRGEMPAATGAISVDSQRNGILESAERFYSHIPRGGEHGELIRRSIARLGDLLRMNRFADKPVECGAIGFSVRLEALSECSQSVIEEAEKRSFLLRGSGTRGDSGLQNDRSTKQVWDKFYMNRLLCPRFDLGISIRGLLRLREYAADAIFGQLDEGPFKALRQQWQTRLMWPFGRDDALSSSWDMFER